ncbi:MAG: 4Fe-4S binding protein [Elusimicrobiota bacterium]
MRGFFNANRNAGLENKVKKAIVDDSKCLSCGACIEVCPRGAIKLKDKAVVNYEKCVGCGYCVVRCPAKAISLK